MKTIILKIHENYFDSFMTFLKMMPKRAIKIEDEEYSKLNNLQNYLYNAFEDIKHKRVSKTGKTIQLKTK